MGLHDVLAVSHLGRTIPARLRTAVEELHPECDIEGCNVTRNLDIDRNVPIEDGGPTAWWNLDRLCPDLTSTSTDIGCVWPASRAACGSCPRTSGCRDVELSRARDRPGGRA